MSEPVPEHTSKAAQAELPADSETPATPQDSAARGNKGEPKWVAKPDEPVGASEIGGPAGPEPTRYGDWERKGRCIDF